MNKIKNVGVFLFILLFAFPFLLRADVSVDTYYRSDPDSNPYNNYSFPGNTNPYTGKTAGGNADTYLSNYYGIKDSNIGLYKILNADGLRQTLNTALPDNSKELLKASQDFQKEIEQDRKDIQNKIDQLQSQSATSIFNQCVYPSSTGCTTEDQYSRMRALDSSSGLLGTDTSNNRLNQCRSEIDTYNQKFTQYNQCISNTQNQAINSIGDKAVELANLQKQNDYYASLLTQKQKETSALQLLSSNINMCQSSHGTYGHFNKNTNQCECQSGFAPDSDSPYQCIPLVIWCKAELGIGGVNKVDNYVDNLYVDDTCGCEVGYDFNSDKTQCIKKPDSFDPSKYGATPVTPTPKKTLSLAEIKTNNTKVASETTSTTTPKEKVLTNTTPLATSTLVTPPVLKQSLFQKVKSFLFKWWK